MRLLILRGAQMCPPYQEDTFVSFLVLEGHTCVRFDNKEDTLSFLVLEGHMCPTLSFLVRGTHVSSSY